MTEPDAGLQLRPIVVIGAGFAGVAAAWSASRSGAKVILVQGSPGASSLYSGAIDGPAPSPETLELCTKLGLIVGQAPRAVATREGVVRTAIGRERSLLDVEALSGRHIALAGITRDDWDARLLAASLGSSDWARRTQTQFSVVPLALPARGGDRRIVPFDFARRFDDAVELGHLAEALRVAEPQAAGWLFGPWLGVQREAASQLAAAIGRPVGESTSAPGGVAGARFELRREVLLTEVGVVPVRGRALRVEIGGNSALVELNDASRFEARAVVLALGGVATGGVVLERNATNGNIGFRLSLEAPGFLSLDGEALDRGSSLWGPSFQRRGLAAIERVGVQVGALGRVAGTGRLFAAGDVVAAGARTVIDALNGGIAAGRAAAAER